MYAEARCKGTHDLMRVVPEFAAVSTDTRFAVSNEVFARMTDDQ
jgi:hypothetical protein